jgi:hypothetical protein
MPKVVINNKQGLVQKGGSGLQVDSTANFTGGNKHTVVRSGGGTTTLTAANAGAVCQFDIPGASNFTLPSPELGMSFTFISTVTATADHVIQAATNNHGFLGGVQIMNTTADENNAFSAAADGNNDFITLNGTTTGGIAGTSLTVHAVSGSSAAGCWAVQGQLIGSGNTITPFGDSQI